MLTMLDEQFAPTTSKVGFVNAPLEIVVAEYRAWMLDIYEHVDATDLDDEIGMILPRLEPLTIGGAPRSLWVGFGADWTAYFDCGHLGSDPDGPTAVLSRRLGVRALHVHSVPNTRSEIRGRGRYGSVQFVMRGPEGDEWGHIRSVYAVNDGGRWSFGAVGEVQSFEETDAYTARRKRDRFTSEMLDRYCKALGVDVFNSDAFGRHATLFEMRGYIDRWSPFGPKVHAATAYERPLGETSLAAIQTKLDIRPGEARSLAG